jgi:hypothetical protein
MNYRSTTGGARTRSAMVKPKNLSRADVRKIEEGLNTNDLEVMIAYIDQVVGNAIRRAKRNLDQRAERDAQ